MRTTSIAVWRSLAVFTLGLLGVALLPGTLGANDAATPQQRVKEIEEEVAAAENTFNDAWVKWKDKDVEDPVVDKLLETLRAKQRAGFTEVVAIAKADPTSAAAFDGLNWLLKTRQSAGAPDFPLALTMLRDHHATNPRIGSGIAILAYYPPRENERAYREVYDLIETVVAKSPDKVARAQAALGLAWRAKFQFEQTTFKNEPAAEQLRTAAINEFENVLRDYGDCANLRTLSAPRATPLIGGEAERELFELRNLQIGKPAPEIMGEDLEGNAFRLSDSRGQVTLLVFWASWCGPCMGAVPHERELVARFRGRPFVLIGVNGDDTRQEAQNAVTKHDIPWRSFWNGEKGAGGPIAAAWNVRGWPTVYVLDHHGIIRHRQLHREELDEPLEELVAAADKEAATKE